MNKEKLYESFQYIDNAILERSEQKSKRKVNKNMFVRIGTVAACLCLMICGTVIYTNHLGREAGLQSNNNLNFAVPELPAIPHRTAPVNLPTVDPSELPSGSPDANKESTPAASPPKTDTKMQTKPSVPQEDNEKIDIAVTPALPQGNAPAETNDNGDAFLLPGVNAKVDSSLPPGIHAKVDPSVPPGTNAKTESPKPTNIPVNSVHEQFQEVEYNGVRYTAQACEVEEEKLSSFLENTSLEMSTADEDAKEMVFVSFFEIADVPAEKAIAVQFEGDAAYYYYENLGYEEMLQ